MPKDDIHRKRIGDLYIVVGVLIAALAAAVVYAHLADGPQQGRSGEVMYGALLFGSVAILIGVGIAVSVFAFQRNLRGSTAAMVLSAGIAAFAFPIGTILAAYALWYLLGDARKALDLAVQQRGEAAEPGE